MNDSSLPNPGSPGLSPAAGSAARSAGDAAWRRVFDAACAVYRVDARANPGARSRWAWHWAGGKLGRDPVFRGMLERGDLPSGARVVDIGCGQGLVAALLHACMQPGVLRAWPAGLPGGWPPAPSARAYAGIELMARDADRGNAALHRLPFAPHITAADMRDAAIPPCDVVVILDVLHYVDHAAQDRVLERVRDALAQGKAADGAGPARLLLRVGDAAHQRRYAISQWVDRVVTVVRGHRAAPTWGRTLPEWTARLQALGFGSVQSVPMSQGTPFANVLLVADLTAGVTAGMTAGVPAGISAGMTADPT